jgi:hypothetical protein
METQDCEQAKSHKTALFEIRRHCLMYDEMLNLILKTGANVGVHAQKTALY